ncbi:MAG: DUF2330 domain-containing protein [Herpetosiphonaceae bacterium]|nr:DUF2330 domain-containing protein [Herpetosiphonaceae bacterium]
MRQLLFLLMVLVVALQPQPAAACGGLFCTNTPVDQAVERIIFAVNQDYGEITAYVQINYTGGATDFSWVVPVPSDPLVDVAETGPFSELSDLTRTRFIFPPPPSCSNGNKLRSVGLALDGHSSTGVELDAEQSGVDIYQRGSVGPYDFAVIGGERPELLIGWLRENGYRLTPEMEPLIAVYTDGGMLFLAMKLQGGRGVQDIQPIKMRYKGTQPMIPIRLTAVAATPNMGMLVWIFADAQMTPENMEPLYVDDNKVALTDQFGGNNYSLLRGAVIDTVGGHGFITEYAQPTSEFVSSDPEIALLAVEHRYLTRLYAEMSPEEMTIDPVFKPDAKLATVSNIHDYSRRPSPYTCDDGIKSVSRQQSEARWGIDIEMLFCLILIGIIAAVLIGNWVHTVRQNEKRDKEWRKAHER